eukprot:4937439-Ditylum_brightwellii.AAC.1
MVNENTDNSTSTNVGQLSQERTTVTFAQSDILPTCDFVDMDKAPYAWALVFPTVFLPCFISGKWVIPGNYICWHTTCDKLVRRHEWYDWLTWRTDGRAMGHPTLCLVLYIFKQRKVIQGQGHVALRSEDVDCKMNAEEFLQKWDNGESQNKLKNKLLLYSFNVAVLVHELGSTRGSLHLHHLDTVDQYDDSCTDVIDNILADLSDEVVDDVSNLEVFIKANNVHTNYFPKYDVNPLHTTAFSIWELFIKDIEGGKQVLKECKENIKSANCKAGE